MAKSQESFNKKEKEKKRRKKAKEKLERREQRKLEKEERGKQTFEDMIMYVDEDGNLSSTPPDPTKRRKIKMEDIQISVAKKEDVYVDPIRKGQVKFFNHEKGYGFINDLETKESIFVHVNNVDGEIGENDKVSYEVEMGPKGPNAINVRFTPKEAPKPKVVPKPESEADSKEATSETEAKAEPKVDSKEVATETEAKAEPKLDSKEVTSETDKNTTE